MGSGTLPRPRRRDAGFTLLELMIVVAILALVVRFVMPAFIEDLPQAQVQAEANKLAAKLSFLRSEARLRTKQFGIELDTEPGKIHRYRMVLPREQEIVREGSEHEWTEIPDEYQLEWYDLPAEVQFAGVHVGLADVEEARARKIFFDPRGRTAQKVIYLAHRSAAQSRDPRLAEQLTYSLIVPPITGPIEVVKGQLPFKTATDGDF